MELKRWRKDVKGWTQKQLADVLGLESQYTISRYEDGWRIPRPHIVEKIAVLSDGAVTLADHIAANKRRKATLAPAKRRKRTRTDELRSTA